MTGAFAPPSGTVRARDGCQIAYRWDGPADGPVLLLSNSLGARIDMWAPQLEVFTTKFRVLRYDSRGHGASEVFAGSYSLDRLGLDVLELLEGLHIERVLYCGLSLGGLVGQWLGYRAPDRVEKLVLANTAACIGAPSSWQERIDLVQQNGVAAIADAIIARWLSPAFMDASPGQVHHLRAMLLSTSAAGYAGCCGALRDADLRPVTSLIDIPTLVLGGNGDLATPPAQAEALARAIRTAYPAVILNAAHLSNYEASDAFSRHVMKFLTS